MAEPTMKTQECACPAVCKLIVPILMILLGVRALAKQLNGNAAKKQEA